MDCHAVILEVVVACTRDLFGAYGVGIQSVETGQLPQEHQYAAVLGFSGRSVRGALMLAATEGILKLSNPAPASGSALWVAELSNQLVGKVKNHLLAMGLDLSLSSPIAVEGDHLKATGPLATRGVLAFRAPEGSVEVSLNYVLPEGFDFATAGRVPPVANDGDTFLF